MTRMEEMVACLTTTSLEGQCETSDKFPSCSKSMQKKKKKKKNQKKNKKKKKKKKKKKNGLHTQDFLVFLEKRTIILE